MTTQDWQEWTVTVDATISRDDAEVILEDLYEQWAPYSAAVSGLGNRLSATMTLAAIHPLEACEQALEIVTKGLDGHSAHIVEAHAIEVIDEAEADRRMDTPTIPELLGAAEVGELLGVSRQRVHQLHTENPRFPSPVVEVRMGPLWTRASIVAFDAAWSRRPGRPRSLGVV